jgi:hypothetical protein
MKRLLLSVLLIVGSNAAGYSQSITYYFPQVAIGGGWMTTIFISNTMATGTGTATIMLTKSDGTPFPANWIDERGNNVSNGNNFISAQLSKGETRKFVSFGGSLTTGFATVVANSSAILANAMFTEFDREGHLLAEAAVPMSIALMQQALFVDTTSGFKTGLAVANPNNLTLQVHFDLLSDTGQTVASTVRQFAPYEQMSVFLDELFNGLPVMVGRVQFGSTNPLTSVGLRFNPSGSPFTTLAPLAIGN